MSTKILAAGNGKSVVKEIQLLLRIEDFCNKYKPGEYMFNSGGISNFAQ